MRQQQDRFGKMPDALASEARLIVLDQGDDIAARHVAVIRNREAAGVEVEVDARNLSTRNRGANGAGVKQSGKREVVDIARRAGDLLDAFFAQDVATDGPAR